MHTARIIIVHAFLVEKHVQVELADLTITRGEIPHANRYPDRSESEQKDRGGRGSCQVAVLYSTINVYADTRVDMRQAVVSTHNQTPHVIHWQGVFDCRLKFTLMS